jgi:hypothetical protein
MNFPANKKDICLRFCIKSEAMKTARNAASLVASVGMAIAITSIIFLLIPGKQIKNPLAPTKINMQTERPSSILLV